MPREFVTRNPLQDQLVVVNAVGWTMFAVAAIAGVIQANIGYEEYRPLARGSLRERLRLAIAPATVGAGISVGATLEFWQS
jgi:hypothetical protein